MNYRGEWFVFFKHRVPFEMLFPAYTGELDRNGNKIKSDRELNILEMENELAPYKVGDAVAQVKFNRVESVNWEQVVDVSDTSRGADGGLVRQ